MDKVAWINLLYDFYGQLLTDRQQRLMELYYEEDFSLGEIADKFDVSRQAVHDGLKRAEQMLTRYEDKMQLVSKFMQQREQIARASSLLDDFSLSRDDLKIEQVRQILSSLLEIVKQ